MYVRRLAIAILLLVLLGGCVPVPPPRPFVSPLTLPAAGTRAYFPICQGTMKFGLAGGSAEQVRALGGNWAYNWSPIGRSEPGYEFVPMVWGRFTTLPYLPPGTIHALMQNECDLAEQCNMSPQETAVQAHELFIAYPYIAWGAPVPSSVHPNWIDDYYEAYRQLYGSYPPHAFLTMHCYYWSAAGCIKLAERFYAKLQKYNVPELWITEFTFTEQKSGGNAAEETKTYTAWLNAPSQFWIRRYSPFIAVWPCDDPYWGQLWNCKTHGDPSLFTVAGEITEIGRWYAQGR